MGGIANLRQSSTFHEPGISTTLVGLCSFIGFIQVSGSWE
jgi:hypothetical protein